MKKENNDLLKKVYGYFIPSAWKLHKGYFIARVLKLFASTVAPFVSIIFIPAIVSELMGNKDANTLIKLAASIVIIEFILAIANGILGNIIERYGLKYENYYNIELSKRIMELDFQITEDKKALDQLELARNGMSWYSGGVNGLMEPLFDAITGIITLLGVAYLIVLKAPIVLAIATVIVIATAIVNSKQNKLSRRVIKT